MDEVEIVRNIEDAGFVAEAPQHALRDPRRSDLPRARGAADARARDRARRRRHADARGAALVSRAQPSGKQERLQDGASGLRKESRRAPSALLQFCNPAIHDPLPRRLDPADQRAADPRRLGRRRSRPRASALGAGAASASLADGAREVDLGDVAVLPGLVNAHTHLELSYLRDEVPPASQFVTWIRGVMAARRERPDPERAGDPRRDRSRASRSASPCGTAIVGDISNTLRHLRAAGAQPARRRSCSTS